MTIRVDDDLLLRSITEEDADVIYRSLDENREIMRRWLPFVDELHSSDDELVFIHSVLAQPEEVRCHSFVILDCGTFCGLIGFVNADFNNKKTEIGYWLVPDAWHKGIMTKAVKCLTRWAFDKWGMNRVQIKCAVKNVESNSVACRCGYVLEGTERAGELLSDGFADLNVYSMLAEEFRQ